jgi:hypothetical protein
MLCSVKCPPPRGPNSGQRIPAREPQPSSRHAILTTVSNARSDPYVRWALELAQAAAAVANYCDHAEHNEGVDRAWVTGAARALRDIACAIAAHEEQDLRDRYAARLRQIEQRNPLWSPADLDGGALVEQAATWRDLQLAQAEHDRRYHPDVVGMAKLDQLRHYALHVAKLVGAVAQVAQGGTDRADFCARRLPDLLLFGLKLSTVTGASLAEDALPAAGQPLRLVAG